jgi:hypothetical protein
MMDSVTTVGGPGSICYLIEIRNAVPPTAIEYTWKTPNGTVVAVTDVDPATPNIFHISCSSRTYDVDTNSSVCQGQSVIPACSTVGACAF